MCGGGIIFTIEVKFDKCVVVLTFMFLLAGSDPCVTSDVSGRPMSNVAVAAGSLLYVDLVGYSYSSSVASVAMCCAWDRDVVPGPTHMCVVPV